MTARVASLGVKNANGRTLASGVLGGKDAKARAVLSAWNHSSMPGFFDKGQMPVGYGTIEESKDNRYLMAEWGFLDGPEADKTYDLLKSHRGIQWSIGYKPTKYDEAGLVIMRATVVEGSPVILGASPNTRTTRVDAELREATVTDYAGLHKLVEQGTITADEARERAGFDGPVPTPEPADVDIQTLGAPVFQDAAPEEPGQDALWVDTSGDVELLKQWNGSEWLTIGELGKAYAGTGVGQETGGTEALRHILSKYGG